jgi:chromosome segregation ATPase
VIEYALLFGLGFLAAALIVMLVAPAIHRRIVLYTENRLKATMPLSPQEIRAQKDMVRAVYAAENARTAQELLREREASIALRLANDTLSRDASHLVADNQDLRAQIHDMSVEAADFRSKLRRAEVEADNLKEALRRTEESAAAKDLEITTLGRRIERIMADVDNLKIERTTRETEIENLKMRVQALRDEREELRRETKLLTKRAKDAEIRLAQEEHKLLRLDDRLAREMADNVDKDALLERRAKEIARLKQGVKSANSQVRAAMKSLRAANLPVPDFKEIAIVEDEPTAVAAAVGAVAGTADLEDELRHRHTALTERLLKAKTATNDKALREEIADIAAKMIVLTAAREGEKSPIPDLLRAKSAKGPGKGLTLAERVLAIDPSLAASAAQQSPLAE